MARFKLSEERENLFSLYQLIHSSLLNNLVGSRIDGLEQEVLFKGKKIDICGRAEDIMQDIFVEVQLIPADRRHMDMIKTIISNINKGIVLWEALTFQRRQHLIADVIEFAEEQKKPVDILFAEINPEVIPLLEQMTTLYPLDVIPNLGRLSEVGEPLRIVKEYRGSNILGERQDDVVGQVQGLRQKDIHEPIRLGPVSLSTRLGANQYVLREIREKTMPYFPGAYRAKSRMDTNAITFGAGDSNTFEISIRDSYSRVKFRIARKNQDVFKDLKLKRAVLESKIGYRLNFKEELSSYVIDVSILSSSKRLRTEVLDEVIEVFKRFVDFFTQYFYILDRGNKIVDAR